jgi:hypothetical protein
VDILTAFGAVAVGAMLVFYAVEDRSTRFVLAFAGACLASSAYGFLQGAWPFGVSIPQAAGLGPKTASGSGTVSWSWTVSGRTTPGSWPVTVLCTIGGTSASATKSIAVQ